MSSNFFVLHSFKVTQDGKFHCMCVGNLCLVKAVQMFKSHQELLFSAN